MIASPESLKVKQLANARQFRFDEKTNKDDQTISYPHL